MDQNFVERLGVLAEIAGTLTRLARLAEISQAGLRKYTLGGEPTRPVLIALARASATNVLWLVDGTLPVCPAESPVVIRAAQDVARHFEQCRRVPELVNLPSVPAADEYAALYNQGESYEVPNAIEPLPRWVMAVLPRISREDVLRWTGNNFSRAPSYFSSLKPGGDGERKGWLEAPSELIVMFTGEIEQYFGDNYGNIERKKKAFILERSIKMLMTDYKNRNLVMQTPPEPELVHSFISVAAYFYDRQMSSGSEK